MPLRLAMASAKRSLIFSDSSKKRACQHLNPNVVCCQWHSLGITSKELNLGLTLFTGQTFLWKQTSPGVFTGVVNSHLVSLKQTPQDTFFQLHAGSEEEPVCSSDRVKQALEEFFTLHISVESLWAEFSAADARFAELAPYIQGSRVLRQDPLECVFQFLCSTNNHIARITKMANHLAALGCYLGCVEGHSFYAFPTLEQLSLVSEKQLQEAGFGYRAKFIVGTIEALRSKEGGGEKWLRSLRDLPLEEATTALCTLPGVGPKVAACVALFSLDKHHAIPVDTHISRIAAQYLAPELVGKPLTLRTHTTVSQLFVTRFGEFAGWAHIVFFIAELASHQKLLPSHLQIQRNSSSNSKRQKAAPSPAAL